MISPATKEAVECVLTIVAESLDEIAAAYGAQRDHDSMIVCNAFEYLRDKINNKARSL